MTSENDWDLQAAEYVLGTLSEQDQKVYDALYRVDDDWKRRVHSWQERLDPLHASTPSAQPPEYILAKVLARIDERRSIETSSMSTVDDLTNDIDTLNDSERIFVDPVVTDDHNKKGHDEELSNSAQALLSQWKESVRYWKFAAAFAFASAIGILFLTPWYLTQRLQLNNDVRTVAVLQDESDGAVWVVSYYQKSEAITKGSNSFVAITAVGEPQLSAEQSHQLWMVLPQEAGVRSVGLIPDKQGETITLELPISLDEAGEFAVSLEPLGGVPGPAHGPVVARTFILKTPEAEAL